MVNKLIRHYNTWILEGDNRFKYKYYSNPLSRLAAAGYNEFGGSDKILFNKKEVVEYIGERINDLEFVYSEYGSCYRQYIIYSKKLN